MKKGDKKNYKIIDEYIKERIFYRLAQLSSRLLWWQTAHNEDELKRKHFYNQFKMSLYQKK